MRKPPGPRMARHIDVNGPFSSRSWETRCPGTANPWVAVRPMVVSTPLTVATCPGYLPVGSRQEAGIQSEVDVAPDASDFRVVYDPGHPDADADADGYLLLPNVNPITEMVDMIAASRAYEANVSAVQASKDMFNDALKI